MKLPAPDKLAANTAWKLLLWHGGEWYQNLSYRNSGHTWMIQC